MIDYRAQLAALPRTPGAVAQDAPLEPQSITLHYSGVVTPDRTPAAERARLLNEARYHLSKNWRSGSGAPVYASRYQYHAVVLSDGATVWCNDLIQLWHAGNITANRTSISVHVMLGGVQDLTPVQRASLFTLFDTLRAAHGIPQHAVYGHCEWPRGDGPARPLPSYQPQPLQSRCPGPVLFRHVVAYRAVAALTRRYRARTLAWVRPTPSDEARHVRVLRPGVLVSGTPVVGKTITRGSVTSGEWLKLDDGYVWLPQLSPV